MLPNFIIGGTLPAGTGHLYGLLQQHPEVFLAPPMQPECNFFFKTGEYEKGLAHYETKWFSTVGKQKAIGERSSLLLSGEWVPPRVAKHLPNVQLIFLFRNPVDRAYANYRFTALAGHESVSFEEAIATEPARMEASRAQGAFWGEIQPHSYFHRGLYFEQLTRWLAHFKPEQLLLMRSDELLKDQDAGLRKIYRFLGIDDSFVAGPFSDFSSPAVVDVNLQRTLRVENPKEFDATVQTLRERLAPTTELGRRMAPNVSDGYEPLSKPFRAELAARYRESNLALKKLVPFSVEDWL